jgi:hypothetical protein
MPRRDRLRESLLRETFIHSLKTTLSLGQFMGGSDNCQVQNWVNRLAEILKEVEAKELQSPG